jgi:hypothetical protein
VAYEKPFKVIQDFYLAHEDWNRLQANEQYFFESLGVGHVNSESGSGLYAFGEHTSPEIPCGIARVDVTSDSNGYLAHFAKVATSVTVERVSAGRYLIRSFRGSTDATFGLSFASAQYKASNAPRDIITTYNDGSENDETFIGYHVTLLEWDSASSSWELADFPFVFTAYNAES